MALKETPKKEDLLALLSGVVGANSSQDPVPLPIAPGMAGTPPPVYAETTRTPADTSYGTPVVPAVIEQPMMNFGATGSMKAFTSDIRRQQEELKNNVSDQQDYLTAMKGQKASRDISPTVAYLSSVAGMDPTAAKTLASAAKGQTPEDMRAELQKALAGAVEGRNKLNDNQINLLKALESDKTSANNMKAYLGDKASAEKVFREAGNKMNEFTASSRNVLGKTADADYRISKAVALASTEKDPNKLIPTQIAELNEALAAVVGGGGSSSEGRINSLSQQTLGMDYAKLKSYLSTKTQPAGMGDFVGKVMHMLQRESDTLKELQAQAKQKIYDTYNPALSRNANTAADWKVLHTKNGIDENGNIISLPSKEVDKTSGTSKIEAIRNAKTPAELAAAKAMK